VAGGFRIDRVSTGGAHTCGETTQNRAVCWGNNRFGNLGDGTQETQRLTPVAVVGGLSFSQLTTGLIHSCGVTSESEGYCWGNNQHGEMGNGTTGSDKNPTPTPVVAPT
jgi:alpha-tubulin suppressor-like RCC1 family protein